MDPRVESVFESMVNFMRKDEKQLVIDSLARNVFHVFKCGTRMELLQVAVDVDKESILVIITFDVAYVEHRVNNLREAAAVIVQIFDHGRVCSDCAGISWLTKQHRCPMKVLGVMMGANTTCVACQFECAGTTTLSCGHRMHLVCKRKVTRCPVCRSHIED